MFGYYIEVTKANAKAAPSDYERKQTLVNAERFTTPELKEYEAKILTAQERSGEIERPGDLRRSCGGSCWLAAGRMRETARRVAEIDLLACLCAPGGAARMDAAGWWMASERAGSLWVRGIRKWSSGAWRKVRRGAVCA